MAEDALSVPPFRRAVLQRIADGKDPHAPGHKQRFTTLALRKLREAKLIVWAENDDAKRAAPDDGYVPLWYTTDAGDAVLRVGTEQGPK